MLRQRPVSRPAKPFGKLADCTGWRTEVLEEGRRRWRISDSLRRRGLGSWGPLFAKNAEISTLLNLPSARGSSRLALRGQRALRPESS